MVAEDIRKALVSFLGKLNLPESEDVQDWTIKATSYLIDSIRSVSPLMSSIPILPAEYGQKCPLSDAVSRNALNKFDAVVLKKYAGVLEGFDHEAFRDDEREEVQHLIAYVDDM